MGSDRVNDLSGIERSFDEIETIIRRNLSDLESDFGIKKIGVFGSFVKNEQTPDSDVDILIEYSKPMGFVKLIKLENHLCGLLKTKVDLVPSKALKPHIGKQILKEARYVD